MNADVTPDLLLAGVAVADAFGTRLVAPCGSENVHIAGVDVLQGDHAIEVRRATTMRAATNHGRGSVVVMRFVDEHNHVFDVAIRFHKGSTYMERSHCRPVEAWPETLWRD